MKFEKGNSYGNRFTSENQPQKRGRKPKLYTVANKTHNISFDDFRNVVMHLLQMTIADLKKYANDPDNMAWVVNVARAIIMDSSKGRIVTLTEMTDRFFGKPTVTLNTHNETELVQVQRLDLDTDELPEDLVIELADRLQDAIKKKVELEKNGKNDE